MGAKYTYALKCDARRNALYNKLLEIGNVWIMQEYLLDLMGDWYPKSIFKIDMHNSTARRTLSDDIQKINCSPKFEKLIFCSSKGIKLATYEESFKYIDNQYKAIFRKLKRIRTLENKAKQDGQYVLIDERFIDAFIDKFERSKNSCHTD